MMITSKNFMIKDIFLILCLKISIDKREPTVPPISEENKSFFSEILEIFLEVFNDFSLSYA